MPISWQMSTAITVCEYEPEEILSIVRQAEVLYGQGMAMPVALAAGEPILVPQRILKVRCAVCRCLCGTSRSASGIASTMPVKPCCIGRRTSAVRRQPGRDELFSIFFTVRGLC